jgi:hypothetical protein
LKAGPSTKIAKRTPRRGAGLYPISKTRAETYLSFIGTETDSRQVTCQEQRIWTVLVNEDNNRNPDAWASTERWRIRMKNYNVVFCVVAASAVALSFLAVGCDREISKTTRTSVNNDGTVKTQEKTVSQSPDGTVTKTQESKTTETNTK